MSKQTSTWQIGEDLLGILLPMLREVRELKMKIDLEKQYNQDEQQYGSSFKYKVNSPTPESPEKINHLSTKLVHNIMATVKSYEELITIETDKFARTANPHIGQVSTTCPDVGSVNEEMLPYPIRETVPPLQPMQDSTDSLQSYAGIPGASIRLHQQRDPNLKGKLIRDNAIEMEENL